MQIAIVGLAGSGKTTVFNTLTRGHAQTGGFGALTLNVGVVKVPDARLDRLAELFKPKKVVQADVTYVDLPAPPRLRRAWAPRSDRALARLREPDTALHVVRAFDDPSLPHPSVVDPGGTRAADLSSSRRPLDGRSAPGAFGSSGKHGRPPNASQRARGGRTKRLKVDPRRAPHPRLGACPRRGEGGARLDSLPKPVLVLLTSARATSAVRPPPCRRHRRRHAHQHAMVDHPSANRDGLGELDAADAATFVEELGIASQD